MASNKIVTIPPIAIPTTCGNLISPGTASFTVNAPENSTNLYYILRHLRVTNRTTASVTFGLFLTTTADATAGREFIWACTATGGPPATAITASTGVVVGNQGGFVEWIGLARVSAADTNKFITGIATATGLVLEGEGEIGVA